MIVLKLGGSLLSSAEPSYLRQWLSLASEQGKGKLVIVPGGGVFADQVRLMQKQWHYNDQKAHYMALLAMQQMALLLQGLCSNLVIIDRVTAIAPALAQQQVVLWSPLAEELDADDVPASWDVTSDSLAAWLAVQLAAAQLVLVKSVEISVDQSVEQLVALGVIDKAFAQFVQGQDLAIRCLERQQLAIFAACLT
ncbi:MAG: 5-(aminomethyl)-3-furanmethanol phosphate kinase [Methyloprofundus sp.]|nr:MAG: 5-(aminomethyl)-3-furanmethanol phosphate kinase [Methyloprofundus sp.]